MRTAALVILGITMWGQTSSAQEKSERLRLQSTTSISGVRCAHTGRAYAELFPSGALRTCPLARDSVVSGHALVAGTWVEFDTSGALRFAWLAKNTVLSGHECRGTGHKGWSVHFRQNGALQLCYLARDTILNGVPCMKGTFWNELRGGGQSAVTFHPDGSLDGCQLLRDLATGGMRFRKRDRIARDASGVLRRIDRVLPLDDPRPAIARRR